MPMGLPTERERERDDIKICRYTSQAVGLFVFPGKINTSQ